MKKIFQLFILGLIISSGSLMAQYVQLKWESPVNYNGLQALYKTNTNNTKYNLIFQDGTDTIPPLSYKIIDSDNFSVLYNLNNVNLYRFYGLIEDPLAHITSVKYCINNFDLNGDGINEIFSEMTINSFESKFVIYDIVNNNVLFDFAPTVNTFLLIDVDGNGKVDILCDDNHRVKLYTTTANSTNILNQNNSELNFKLNQNYPNPYNSQTTIEYSLERPAYVNIKIYDMTGREVYNVKKGMQGSGSFKEVINFNSLSSGTYFYQLILDNEFLDTKKMILVK